MKDKAIFKNDIILLCEWDEQEFRKKLAYWESIGYQACFNTYKVEPDSDPCTGRICLRYSIDLKKTEEGGTERKGSSVAARG